VTPANVTGISQTAPLLSATKSEPTPRQATVTPTKANAVEPKNSKPAPVDTVRLSQQSQQAISSVKKEEPKKVEGQKQDVNTVNTSEKPTGSASSIQYEYDLKGN
jgi:hypothetical protein